MDRQRFSAIAHADHGHASPISPAKVDRLCGVVVRGWARDSDAAGAKRVLDIGCGKAAWLLRLAELCAIDAIGVDTNGAMIDEARGVLAQRGSRAAIDLRHVALEALGPARREFDAVLCIGSDAAFGRLPETLAGVRSWTKPGGVVVLGLGYWKQAPHADYLAHLGATADEMVSHADNARALGAAGCTLLYSAVASEDEWDHYEGLYLAAVERYLEASPNDVDADAMRARIRGWRDVYLARGRDTLGFGYYVARVEA